MRSTPYSSAIYFPASLAVGDGVGALAVLVPPAVLPISPVLPVSDVVDFVADRVDVVDTTGTTVVTLVSELAIVVGVASGELATHWALGHSLQSNDSTTSQSSPDGQAGQVGMTSGQTTHPLYRGWRAVCM